jgi:hypothetical protein
VTNPSLAWMPLGKLSSQFDANLSALRRRNPDLAARLAAVTPSTPYRIATENDRVVLAQGEGATVFPNPVPANSASQIARQIFPAGVYNTPLLIAGLDQGWLWQAIYHLNCTAPYAPGLRLPLFLMAGQLERLWAVLHYQNWGQLLCDTRVQLFAGADAMTQLRDELQSNPRMPAPRLAITVEPQLWANGENLNSLTEAAASTFANRLTALQRELNTMQDSLDLSALSEKIRDGQPLRILGITSRYTTFLQHSMRDWLGAFEKMGHQTRLLIEQADHEIMPAVIHAAECRSFQPDLILVIDHCRGEMPGLPRRTPCVMWVQDRLPNIYRPEAGAMQDRTDYVIGYGMQECTARYGYPAERFMPAMVGVNEVRFAPAELSESQLTEYACDVSFVSHASTTAEQIVKEESERAANPQVRALLSDIYDRLRAIYDAGVSVTEPPALDGIIDAALLEKRLGGDVQALRDLVKQRLNNALLRHQAIRWAAAAGVDLRLYGKGWENHPEFSRYARGVADNQNQLALIYQASHINMQVTPFGAAHQRLFEGLSAGGFFLLRAVTGDAVDLLRREVWSFCRRNRIQSGREMVARGRHDRVYPWLMSQLETLMGTDPVADAEWFFIGLREAALGGFARTASTLWPEYDQVAFWSQTELGEKLKFFLANADARRDIAQSMRRRVLECHTYTAISQRMLSFIAGDLVKKELPVRVAA